MKYKYFFDKEKHTLLYRYSSAYGVECLGPRLVWFDSVNYLDLAELEKGLPQISRDEAQGILVWFRRMSVR